MHQLIVQSRASQTTSRGLHAAAKKDFAARELFQNELAKEFSKKSNQFFLFRLVTT